MANIIENLKKGQDLSFEESKTLFNELMEGKYDENSIIDLSEYDQVSVLTGIYPNDVVKINRVNLVLFIKVRLMLRGIKKEILLNIVIAIQ